MSKIRFTARDLIWIRNRPSYVGWEEIPFGAMKGEFHVQELLIHHSDGVERIPQLHDTKKDIKDGPR